MVRITVLGQTGNQGHISHYIRRRADWAVYLAREFHTLARNAHETRRKNGQRGRCYTKFMLYEAFLFNEGLGGWWARGRAGDLRGDACFWRSNLDILRTR